MAYVHINEGETPTSNPDCYAMIDEMYGDALAVVQDSYDINSVQLERIKKKFIELYVDKQPDCRMGQIEPGEACDCEHCDFRFAIYK